MKHVRSISNPPRVRADAYGDFLNALWQAWLEFVFTKKNETLPSS